MQFNDYITMIYLLLHRHWNIKTSHLDFLQLLYLYLLFSIRCQCVEWEIGTELYERAFYISVLFLLDS